jgi:hypothetical protein
MYTVNADAAPIRTKQMAGSTSTYGIGEFVALKFWLCGFLSHCCLVVTSFLEKPTATIFLVSCGSRVL